MNGGKAIGTDQDQDVHGGKDVGITQEMVINGDPDTGIGINAIGIIKKTTQMSGLFNVLQILYKRILNNS